MKKLFVAAALGLGLLFTPAVNAQSPAPAAKTTVHKTHAKATASKADHPRDAQGRFTKSEATGATAVKPAAAESKPSTVRQRDAKGRFVKGDANKPAEAKSAQSHPRDAKGRFVKKTEAPASK